MHAHKVLYTTITHNSAIVHQHHHVLLYTNTEQQVVTITHKCIIHTDISSSITLSLIQIKTSWSQGHGVKTLRVCMRRLQFNPYTCTNSIWAEKGKKGRLQPLIESKKQRTRWEMREMRDHMTNKHSFQQRDPDPQLFKAIATISRRISLGYRVLQTKW